MNHDSDMVYNAKLVLKYRESVVKLSKKYQKKHKEEDIRFSIFNDLDGVLLNSAINFNILAFIETTKLSTEQSKAIFGVDINDTKSILLFQNKVNYENIFLTSVINFQIENCLKIILQTIHEKNPPEKFYKILEIILNELEISESKNKLNILYTNARIRNSLHSHGIHTKENVPKYSIKNKSFEFNKNKPVNCATLDHILVALDSSIEIIDEIFQKNKVKCHDETIHWQFHLL